MSYQQVDGFRFDIMGHHLCRNMDKIRAALDALTMDKDGVDGANVYIYGEVRACLPPSCQRIPHAARKPQAWDFGEMAFNQRGRNASQLNIAGTGLGSFNDRLRDAVLGGGPFAPSKAQGVVTGLCTDSNAFTDADMAAEAQRSLLLEQTDLLRLSLAGNLRDYVIEDRHGQRKRGVEVGYCGAVPAAYAANPWESVNYTSCHDNQTLFDQVQDGCCRQWFVSHWWCRHCVSMTGDDEGSGRGGHHTAHAHVHAGQRDDGAGPGRSLFSCGG